MKRLPLHTNVGVELLLGEPRTGFVQASSCLEDTNDEAALSVATVWEIAITGRPVKVTLLDCWATALARRGFGPMRRAARLTTPRTLAERPYLLKPR